MELTSEQRTLYDRIYKSVRNNESIDEIIKEVKKEDFLKIFTAIQSESKETLLGTFEAASVGHLKAVLNRAKELGLLKKVVRAEILSSKNQDKVESISLIECITDPSRQYPSKVLNNVVEVFKEEFFASLSKDELKKIKVAIEKELENETGEAEQQNLKTLIGSIGEFIESRVEAESDTGKINQKVKIKGNEKVENKPIKTIRTPSTGVVFGCSIAVGLVVGLGFFAAGIPLGYASMAGFMAGIGTFAVIASAIAITSTVCCLLEESKPSKDLNKVDAAQHAAAGADLQHN